jgi:single-strand selective monofunctional uracil DNA glycosylase
MELLEITDHLSERLATLRFGPPITHVYNPLTYARASYAQYLERFVPRFFAGSRQAVFLGMNPGPFGMTQTGVPFGEVASVRDWLGIEAPVGRPRKEHPKRPIEGFSCTRSEVSGARLWGWAAARFGTPERFFGSFLILNYCPLVFLEASGRNFTPDKLPTAERAALEAACDEALARSIAVLAPRRVIGIGKFAESRAKAALGGLDLPIHQILHPSPASPAANRGWAEQVERQLREIGIRDLGRPDVEAP